MTDELERVVAEATAIAEAAGELLMGGFRMRPRTAEKKGFSDLVTEYDVRSEALVKERLRKAFPTHRIVGEEGTDDGAGALTWYVDPLDGTTNFAHGHHFFGVALGLFDGEAPLVGVVRAPALGVTWSAARGLGAKRNGAAIRVSEVEQLHVALTATGSGAAFLPDPTPALGKEAPAMNEMARFGTVAQGVRRCGAAAVEIALVADGTYDLFWDQGLGPWDIAAGIVIVSEAGGRATDRDGAPALPTRGVIVASNGRVHAEALAALAAR